MVEHKIELFRGKWSEAHALRTLRLLANVVELAPMGVAITSPEDVIEYANPRLCDIFSSSCREMVGTDLCTFRTTAGAQAFKRARKALLSGDAWQGEAQFQSKTGQTVVTFESIYPVHERNRLTLHFMHFVQEVGGGALAAEAFRHLAFYDSLTGLPNRNLLLDRLDQAIAAAQRNRTCFALVYIDVDRFKNINDRFGHEVGDDVLRAVAARLRGALRESDTLGRLGGDEFVSIIDKTGDSEALSWVAGKLVAACTQLRFFDGSHCAVTVSVGVSVYPRDGQTAQALLKAADGAMYQAKTAGRNTFRLALNYPDAWGGCSRQGASHAPDSS